jgi:hypothetical protein
VSLLVDAVAVRPASFRESKDAVGEHGVRAFSGKARSARRKLARSWHVTTADLTQAEADSLEAKLILVGPVAVTGTLMDPAVNCFVADITKTPLPSANEWRFSFRLIEATP